jgi:glycosyltransferase involved in cell wall biosynthesis
VTVCGPAATDALFGFSAAAGFAPVGIPGGLAPVADTRAVLRLRRAVAGVDLLHAHGLRAGLVAAAARQGRPLVITLHNPVPRGRAPELAARAAVRAADVVLAASPDLAAAARRLGARDVRDAPVAAPALPPPRRTPAEVRAELGLAGSRPLVLAVGRLHPQKGHDVLLDAAARWAAELPAPPLVAVAGDGPLAPALAAQVRDRRLPVLLLGHRTDVADLLAAADVVVLPSRWEARSLAAQEALRAGRPLVATRTGALPGLLADGAELVPPDDAGALAGAVAGLLADPARAQHLTAAGRRRAQTWPDAADTARRVVAVYRELLGPPGPS